MNGDDLVLLSPRLDEEKIRSVLGSSPRPDRIFNETDTLAQLLGEKDTTRSKMAYPQTVLTERGPIKVDLDQVKRGDKVTVI